MSLSIPIRLLSLAFCFLVGSAFAQQEKQEGDGLSGPDVNEHAPNDRGHLFGKWGGERQHLSERGLNIDLQYLSDSLWNLRSAKKERLANWSRVRGTVDIDFGKLTEVRGLTFHITGLWQGGGNLGSYLGTIAGPSSIVSVNTFRLDSYWLEKSVSRERVVFRFGQFAGQDFYGTQHDGNSFFAEPLGYALGNLGATYETFDPPSTPAAELRVIPLPHLYVKSAVFAADRIPYAHNPTGFIPQFLGAASVVSELGWTPGQQATSVRAFDTIAQRRGYAGLYQLGSSINPGKFQSSGPVKSVSGNYLIYVMASQAVWRTGPASGVGLDVTAATDWTPADRSRVPRQTTFGLRFNEPLPIHQHNTVAFGYVRSVSSQHYPSPEVGLPLRTENLLELNGLIEVTRSITLQPVVQRFINVGGTEKPATIFGFRSKVDF